MIRWSSLEAPSGFGISPWSSSVTRCPWRVSAQAVARPMIPAPTMRIFIAAPPSRPGAFEGELRRGEVLERGADRFEDGDLVVVAPPAARAARQLEEVAGDVVLGDDPGAQRLDDVARLLDRPGAGVDEDAAALHRLVVRLAHLRGKAADQVEMDAERQP